MNLYTRIWLRLAPKGWQAVSTNYFNDRANQIKELRRERDAMWRIIQDLRKGYNRLASIISTTTTIEEVLQNANETSDCT